MDENITAENFSRRFSGIQHTILRWNDKELDDGLFVNVFPIDYELCLRIQIHICIGFFIKWDVYTWPDYQRGQWPSRFCENRVLTEIVHYGCKSDVLHIFPLRPINTCLSTVTAQKSHFFSKILCP